MKKGNTLIITIFLVTLFIFVGVGLVSFIFQSSSNIRSTENSQKALYAAESGVELSLLELKKHEAGYEASGSFDREKTETTFEITALTDKIPSEDDQISTLTPTEIQTFALFKDISTSDDQDLKDLKDANTTFAVTFESEFLSQNCLRWTIFGFTNYAGQTITESIGGVLPCSPTQNSFGNSSGVSNTTGQFKDQTGTFFPDHPIETFLQDHQQNYLSLANISEDDEAIHYVLAFEGQKMADQFFRIISSGTINNFTQTEEVLVPQGETLDSFFFAIVNPD